MRRSARAAVRASRDPPPNAEATQARGARSGTPIATARDHRNDPSIRSRVVPVAAEEPPVPGALQLAARAKFLRGLVGLALMGRTLDLLLRPLQIAGVAELRRAASSVQTHAVSLPFTRGDGERRRRAKHPLERVPTDREGGRLPAAPRAREGPPQKSQFRIFDATEFEMPTMTGLPTLTLLNLRALLNTVVMLVGSCSSVKNKRYRVVWAGTRIL